MPFPFPPKKPKSCSFVMGQAHAKHRFREVGFVVCLPPVIYYPPVQAIEALKRDPVPVDDNEFWEQVCGQGKVAQDVRTETAVFWGQFFLLKTQPEEVHAKLTYLPARLRFNPGPLEGF